MKELVVNSFSEEDLKNEGYFNNLETDAKIINFKSLPLNEKVLFLKACFKSVYIVNSVLIANIILLIKGCSTNVDLFQSEDVIFNDISEYIEIKQQLKDEIKEFNTKVVTYYMGAIKGLSIKLDDRKIDIENLYFHSMLVLNLNDISKMMMNVDKIQEILPIKNSDLFINAINSNSSLSVLKDIFNHIKIC